MKFIHTADLHLDSPFDNLRNDGTPASLWKLVYRSTYRSFARIVQAAVKYHVDFILIVGDLFDRRDQNIRAQNFLKDQLNVLNHHHILALISFGNHDYYSGDYRKLDYPDNTYVFPTHVTTKHLSILGKLVNVTGFSYGNRWENDRKINQFPEKSDCDYQIGMIHGQISSGSSNYTPFSLNELLDKHYDYWALGHVHKRRIINRQPPIVYPGNIQGRNPNETGDKGYLLVDSQNQFQPEFHSTSVINWSMVLIKVTSANNENDLIKLILKALVEQRFGKMHLIRIELRIDSTNGFSADLRKLVYNQNLLDQVQAHLKERYREINAWVYQIDLTVKHHDQPVSIDSKLWEKSSSRIFNLDNVDSLAKKLFQYPFINHRFNNPEEIQRLKQQIMQLITNHRGSDDEN